MGRRSPSKRIKVAQADASRRIALTPQQVDMIRKADTALRNAQATSQFVLGSILAAAGIAKGKVTGGNIDDALDPYIDVLPLPE